MPKLNDVWYKYCYPKLVKDSKWVTLLPKNKRPTSDKLIQNVYYVNGVFNTPRQAQKFASKLQERLNQGQKIKDAKVKLLYNEFEGYAADLIECMLDKTWTYGKPIFNPTTIAVIALLYFAKAKKKPIAIVGHSQGTLIVYNAILAFRKQSKSNELFLKNIPVFLCSPMIHASSEVRLAKWTKYTPVKNPKDWLPAVVAGDIGTVLANLIDKSFNDYLPDSLLTLSTRALAKIRQHIFKVIGDSNAYQNSSFKKAIDKKTGGKTSGRIFSEHMFIPSYSKQFNREMFEGKKKKYDTKKSSDTSLNKSKKVTTSKKKTGKKK